METLDFSDLKQNLEKAGYAVVECRDRNEANAYLAQAVENTTVGFGGSVTVQEMGLYDVLAKKNTVYWHWRVPQDSTPANERACAMTSAVYIASVNGIAKTGEIVQIDGTGNRVGAIQYGHEQVIFVVGENKIAPDLPSALDRARNIAAPKNARRLGLDTPCAKEGKQCFDCQSPHRICNTLSIFWRKPGGCRYTVVLIHENLGY